MEELRGVRPELFPESFILPMILASSRLLELLIYIHVILMIMGLPL